MASGANSIVEFKWSVALHEEIGAEVKWSKLLGSMPDFIIDSGDALDAI